MTFRICLFAPWILCWWQGPSFPLGCLLVTLKFELTLYYFIFASVLFGFPTWFLQDIPSIFRMNSNIKRFANMRSTVLHVCQNMFFTPCKTDGKKVRGQLLLYISPGFVFPHGGTSTSCFPCLPWFCCRKWSRPGQLGNFDTFDFQPKDTKDQSEFHGNMTALQRSMQAACLFIACRTSISKYPSYYSNLAS